MELLRYSSIDATNGIRFSCLHLKIIDGIKYIKIILKPGEYKNKKSRTQSKTFIIANSDHPIFNPFLLL